MGVRLRISLADDLLEMRREIWELTFLETRAIYLLASRKNVGLTLDEFMLELIEQAWLTLIQNGYGNVVGYRVEAPASLVSERPRAA